MNIFKQFTGELEESKNLGLTPCRDTRAVDDLRIINDPRTVSDNVRNLIQEKIKGHVFTWVDFESDMMMIFIDNKMKVTHVVDNLSHKIDVCPDGAARSIANEFLIAYSKLIDYTFYRRDLSDND